ncbi:hypothetical protein EVAR_907_1 [Eumeta japonica]|uniref:Uncharacterized protein n=1 Tax=Eumeta variegata TaxID=151549 RepID=A0A4C1SEL1_EUMVA|nr:hypothetical protein EVAR_907_1 [Eumeta japonica]
MIPASSLTRPRRRRAPPTPAAPRRPYKRRYTKGRSCCPGPVRGSKAVEFMLMGRFVKKRNRYFMVGEREAGGRPKARSFLIDRNVCGRYGLCAIVRSVTL